MPNTPATVASAAARLRDATTPRRRLLADRIATWVVSAGGLAIILSILGILVFILAEVWPLTRAAEVRPVTKLPLAGELAAITVDEHRSWAIGIDTAGRAHAVRLADGTSHPLADLAEGLTAPDSGTDAGAIGASTSSASATPADAGETSPDAAPPVADRPRPAFRPALLPGGKVFAAATDDGRVLVAPAGFEVHFDEEQRRITTPELGTPAVLTLDPAGQAVGAFTAALDSDGNALAAAQLANGTLAVALRTVETSFSGDVSESFARHELALGQRLTTLLVDHDRRRLYGGTESGELVLWTLSDGRPHDPRVVSAGSAAVTALTLLVGDRALVVGQGDGALSVWFPLIADSEDGASQVNLARIRDFPPLPAAVSLLAPATRDKGFLAASADGFLGLYFSTSHRTLWTGTSGLEAPAALAFAPKGDGAYLTGGRELAGLAIHNPHPETTLQTLFGKVWFEGYQGEEYVWQSTGGTDDFEPKLSLTPLLVGTLKGTLYSLLLAIPLGVFGAMYLSQFMHPTYKRFVKPAIEIMAALPSVVLGFLAGLWLAPRVEEAIAGMFAMLVALPLVVLASGWSWAALPRGFRGRMPAGTEAFVFLGALALGIWGCVALAPWLEEIAFGGSFKQWLFGTTGLPYDQRNAIVVGLAMGVAVIPIIFAISEDAFSNVPRNLVAGSLALGANRWQTVIRVVLPTASPGIFSAIMIGFGRAVGETMIVLMATGNTPIMDWNPFNGFRTLSANIAVEIPEAPVGSTLYRALFLAALLLFLFTFVVNTAAELVRQRLRERYSRL
jgi:phosphate transport system permease protein